MVGDRLDTDILFGKHGNVSTLLVLTGSSIFSSLCMCYNESSGVTAESEITGPDASPIIPDFVIKSLGDLEAVIDRENPVQRL